MAFEQIKIKLLASLSLCLMNFILHADEIEIKHPEDSIENQTIFVKVKEDFKGTLQVTWSHSHLGEYFQQTTQELSLIRAQHSIKLKFEKQDTLNHSFFDFARIMDAWPRGNYSVTFKLISSDSEKVSQEIKTLNFIKSKGQGSFFNSTIRNNILYLEFNKDIPPPDGVSCICEVSMLEKNQDKLTGSTIIEKKETQHLTIDIGKSLDLQKSFNEISSLIKFKHKCYFGDLLIEESGSKSLNINENETHFIMDHTEAPDSEPLKFSGYARTSSYYKGYNSHYDIHPSTNHSVHVSPTTYVYGIPISTDISLYDNQFSSYHQNSINFSFDHNEYSRQKNTWQNELNSQYEKQLNEDKRELNELTWEKRRLEQEIQNNNLDSSSLSDEYSQSKIREIESKKDKLAKINEKVELKTQNFQQDSVYWQNIQQKKQNIEHNPSYGNNIERLLTNLNNFSIGRNNPFFSEFTISGIPMKGGNIEYVTNSFFLELASGNIPNQFNFNSTPKENMKMNYQNNLVGGRLGYAFSTNNYLAINAVSFQENSMQETFEKYDFNPSNKVFSIEGNFNLSSEIEFNGEVASSKVDDSRYHLNSSQIDSQYNQNANMAYLGSIKYNIVKNGVIEGKLKKTNPSFISLGAPFEIPGNEKFKASYMHSLFDNQLTLEGSYLKTNEIALYQNDPISQHSGYGFSLNASFNKWPILYIHYSPYQSSNYHPDPLKHTHRKQDFLSINSFYQFNLKSTRNIVTLNFNQSKTQFSPNDLVSIKDFSANYEFEIGKLNVQAFANRSKTKPKVDSNNVNTFKSNISYQLNSQYRIMVGTENRFYKNNGEYNKAFLGTYVRLPHNFTLNLKGGVGRIKKLWNYKKHDFLYSNLMLTYRW